MRKVKDPVTWEILSLVVSVMSGTAAVIVWIAFKVHSWALSDLHSKIATMNSSRNLEINKLDSRLAGMDARIQGLELFDAQLRVIIEQMVESRAKIDETLNTLLSERRNDMSMLHRKLDSLLDHHGRNDA